MTLCGAQTHKPLWMASAMGHVEVVRALLPTGASVDLLGDGGSPPLHCASCSGHVEAVRALLSAGASVDLVRACDGTSPLFIACQAGHQDVILELLPAVCGGERGLGPGV